MLLPTNSRKYKPLQISYTYLGEHRDNLRFWQEGLRLSDAGFTKGTPIRIRQVPEMSCFIIEVDKDNPNMTVSGRKKGEDVTPIIDINNQELEKTFGDMRLLRASYFPGKIIAQAHPQEFNRIVAMSDLESNIASGVVTMGTLCVGGGICSTAIKEGSEAEGLRVESEWVVDIENKYLQSLLDNTPVASDRTTIVHGAMNDVEVDQLSPVNVLNMSLPCTGFSPAGIAKNRLENPEAHSTAGTAILKAIETIEKKMPPVIWNENVKDFASSASAALLGSRLRQLGYHVSVGVFGGEMGTLENRERSIMLATHPSLSLTLNTLKAVMQKEACVRDILEPITLDDPMWKTYSYLADKEVRDKAAGKGFARQLLTGDETLVGVLGAGYAKARSTEPFLQHPTNPELSRLFTPLEHARLMKIPHRLVQNLSKTVAHQVMGQSGSYALFTAIGQFMASELKQKLLHREKCFSGKPVNEPAIASTVQRNSEPEPEYRPGTMSMNF